MRNKKNIYKIGRKVPLLNEHFRRQELEKHIKLQDDDITGLREAVTRLEDRNNLWEKEVRELRGEARTLSIVWPAQKEDIIAADWQKPHNPKLHKAKPPFTINWVVPPMGQVSGGNVDIFRTIGYLESQGHHCRVYFYDARGVPRFEDVKKVMAEYPPIKSELFYNAKTMESCDAIFATNWITAYPVLNFKGGAKKFYYVQDFEPFFEPVGSYSTLAENTYRFGFHGLTLGNWLSQKLSREYGMHCEPFEFGVDTNEYALSNTKTRKKVLFYARPVSPRRGFELGMLTMEVFHKEHPEYEINLLGWDVSAFDIPFPYVNHGVLSPVELNGLYNQCAAGLVLSFTNMSLLPLELLASGCTPVVNDLEHTRMVPYAERLQYAIATPKALADALYSAVTSKAPLLQSQAVAEYAKQFQWNDSNKAIDQILHRELT